MYHHNLHIKKQMPKSKGSYCDLSLPSVKDIPG
jgi:hypothetical protein